MADEHDHPTGPPNILDGEIEEAARRLCKQFGMDADRLDENGVAAWHAYREEVAERLGRR